MVSAPPVINHLIDVYINHLVVEADAVDTGYFSFLGPEKYFCEETAAVKQSRLFIGAVPEGN
jgi:hypothetical protein